MFLSHRSNDAVITICQDNAKRAIDVREINPPAEQALGYKADGISGQPLSRFLPPRIQQLLTEYVEYDAEGNDVGVVLAKVQSFCILNSKGREVAFRLKVLRSESLDITRCLGPRPHEAHLTFQDVPELRQFIELRLPQKPPYPGGS